MIRTKRICVVCGKEFTSQFSKTKTCSPVCSLENARRKRKQCRNRLMAEVLPVIRAMRKASREYARCDDKGSDVYFARINQMQRKYEEVEDLVRQKYHRSTMCVNAVEVDAFLRQVGKH